LWRPAQDRDLRLERPDFIEFPVGGAAAGRATADRIILERRPSAVVAIERCGRTRSGRYRNMLGIDISRWTARVDELFAYPGIVTVGIGDGGNEIGMGSLAHYIPGELGITDPVETTVDHLVLATVSNWGAYGIIAYMGFRAGKDLLPADGEEEAALEVIVTHGAIDGLTHRAELSVDGFPPEATSALLAALRRETDS
jgi:hypothetical protein